MSKDKTRTSRTSEEQEPAEAAQGEDPMTSYDPETESNAARPGSREQSASAAPAERNAMGNGSARTAREPNARSDEPETAEAPRGESPAEAQPQPEAGAAPEPPPAGAEPDAETRIAAAEQEAAAQFDRFLRLQAEFENYKKRVAKEHSDSLRYALTPLVTEVAAIMDNLERAVDHARKEQGDGGAALLAGVEMVLKQMQEALGRFGVSRIEAKGKPFDPSLHEAMAVVERNDVPENQVLEEFQAGYVLHDRVVRPARVSVSKRGSEEGRQPASEGG